MSITEERKKKVDFTNKYYQTPARFVAKKGAEIEITPEGLKGKKIGVQRATIHDSFLTDNFGDASRSSATAPQDEANLDLVAGRLDLLFDDSRGAERRAFSRPTRARISSSSAPATPIRDGSG